MLKKELELFFCYENRFIWSICMFLLFMYAVRVLEQWLAVLECTNIYNFVFLLIYVALYIFQVLSGVHFQLL